MDEEIKLEFEKLWEKVNELEDKFNEESNVDEKTPQKNSHLSGEIGIFCKNNQIEENRLKEIIEFQENFPRLINLPQDTIRKKIQFNSLIMLAPIYFRVYKKKLFEKTLRELFELNRIPLERLDKLYSSKEFKKFFNKSGTEIKLLWVGEQKGVNRLKKDF